MQTLNSSSFSSPSSSSSSEVTESESQNSVLRSPSLAQNSEFRSPSPLVARLWRPAAQRNLRNQWSKLASYKQQWLSASVSGMSHAISLVNAFLNQRNMSLMDLGVLSNMPDIRKEACRKLAQEQEVHRSKLLSSYKDLVTVLIHMINVSSSMRCFLKGPINSPLIQVSCSSDDKNDGGDGGGIPVFKFWSIPDFENWALKLVQMFSLELSVKRLLMVELLSVRCKKNSLQSDEIRWSDELYQGEFDHLSICNLYSTETYEPIPPRIPGWKPDAPITVPYYHQPDDEVLKVYLITWRTEVNIDTNRVDEIFAEIGEEMHVNLS